MPCSKIEIVWLQTKLIPNWLEFFAAILSALHSKELVVIEGENGIEEEMTGPEYRAKYIDVLCKVNWMPSNTTFLCKLVKDISSHAPLTPQEHSKVIQKSLEMYRVPQKSLCINFIRESWAPEIVLGEVEQNVTNISLR